jgi:hypothetical protein
LKEEDGGLTDETERWRGRKKDFYVEGGRSTRMWVPNSLIDLSSRFQGKRET